MTDVAAALPLRMQSGSGVRWMLASEDWRTTAVYVSDVLEQHRLLPPHLVLKKARRRLVFLVDDTPPGQVVVKAFPLDTWKKRRGHGKYAMSEARNLLEARRRGVPVPAVFAVGGKGRWWRQWVAVVLQKAPGESFEAHMRANPDASKRQQIFERSAELFGRLYEAGANHIDLKPDALFLAERGEDDVVIDFQYCRFKAQPDVLTLMAQAGHFVYWWTQLEEAGAAHVDQWLAALHQRVPETRSADALAVYEKNRRLVPSIAERLDQ